MEENLTKNENLSAELEPAVEMESQANPETVAEMESQVVVEPTVNIDSQEGQESGVNLESQASEEPAVNPDGQVSPGAAVDSGDRVNPPKKEKGDGKGFGIASMVLGFISLLLFCTCVSYITATVGLILGIVQLYKNKQKTYAVAGIVTSIIAIIFSLAFSIYMGMSTLESYSNVDLDELLNNRDQSTEYQFDYGLDEVH